MKNIFGVIIITLFINACNPSEESTNSIIQNAIEFHGGESYETLNLQISIQR